jgi:hypothetical protein
MISQNGWPVVGSPEIENKAIPGTDVKAVPGLLKGDVAWLLRWVGSEFNKRVDPLITPGCWGWNAPTPIPGSDIYSNHCSGTAIDLNAPHFPWTLKTMSARQREECRKIVNKTEGIVAWGGDFTTITDEMHFEINGSAADVARIVKKLKGEQMSSNAVNLAELDNIYLGLLHRHVDPSGKKTYLGKPFDFIISDIRKKQEWKDLVENAKANKVAGDLKLDKASVLEYLSKNLK